MFSRMYDELSTDVFLYLGGIDEDVIDYDDDDDDELTEEELIYYDDLADYYDSYYDDYNDY
jgi:hypothetical protein